MTIFRSFLRLCNSKNLYLRDYHACIADKQRHIDYSRRREYPVMESYNAKAVSFANTVDRKNCVSFIDKHGSTYKYNKVTNTLAIIRKNGIVITFYKPKDGYDYYLREKRNKAR